MAGEDSAAGARRASGLLGSVRSLAATLVAVAQTRLQLLGNEIEEEAQRLARLGMIAAAAVFFVVLGIIFLTLLVIVLYWDSYRILVIGGFTALYLLLGIGFGVLAFRCAGARSRLFEASLSELAKDRERLSQ